MVFWSVGNIHSIKRYENNMNFLSNIAGITGAGDLTPMVAGFAFGMFMYFVSAQYRAMMKAFRSTVELSE